MEILILLGSFTEISRGERYRKGFYRVEISPKFPTTCYSEEKKGRRARKIEGTNENLCGGIKRASRPRMHVRATNADRKSIKRLLHPRHSAAARPHGNQPLSSLYLPSRSSLLPPVSCLVSPSLSQPLCCSYIPQHTVPYQCAIHPLPGRKGFFQVAQ